jgi:AcrR family transcriptional regulator
VATTTRRRTRRDEQRARTTGELLDAAAKVFAAHGYHAASVDMVAEAAGFTKGAVYSNFASKQELFLALLERHIDRALTVLEELLLTTAPNERTRVLAEPATTLEVLDREWFLLEAEFLLYAARNEEIRTRVKERQRRTHARVTALLRRHLDDLGIPDEVLPAADTARKLIATADGLTQAALADPEVALDGGRLLAETADAILRDAQQRVDGRD